MAKEHLTLTIIASQSSREYALFRGKTKRATLILTDNYGEFNCMLKNKEGHEDRLKTSIASFKNVPKNIMNLFYEQKIVKESSQVSKIGLKVVVPNNNFLHDQLITENYLNELKNLQHKFKWLKDVISEIENLWQAFPFVPLIATSDSSFNSCKPEQAWNYGIDISLSDKLGIKRFGYQGLACESVVSQLYYDLPQKLIVCYLDEQHSTITALNSGCAVDSTSGYWPNEAIFAGSSSDSVPYEAVESMRQDMGLTYDQMVEHLNKYSGLFGLSGESPSINHLLQQAENEANNLARLAVKTYIYNIQKGIGQMVAACGGADALVFTGSVGENSDHIRTKIVNGLDYFGFAIDKRKNSKCKNPEAPTKINLRTRVNQIYVVSADEHQVLATHTIKY